MKSSNPISRGLLRNGLIAIGVLSLCGILALSGCSSDRGKVQKSSEATTYTTEEAQATDISVENAGFEGIYDPTDETAAAPTEYQFVFEVKNSNADYVAKDVAFNVVGMDGDGNMLFSKGVSCPYVYPDITTVVTGSATIPGTTEPDQPIPNLTDLYVEPLMESVDWVKNELTADELNNMFKVSNVEAVSTDSSIEVTATIEGDLSLADMVYSISDYENTLEAHAVAVFSNEDGELMFGSQSQTLLIDQQTLDDIKADSGYRNFSVRLPFAMKYDNVQLYVMPGM